MPYFCTKDICQAPLFSPFFSRHLVWLLVLAGLAPAMAQTPITIPALPPAPLVITVFASAGQSFFRMPNQAGNLQKIEIIRAGQVVLTLLGHGIAGPPVVYANPFWYSGTAHS